MCYGIVFHYYYLNTSNNNNLVLIYSLCVFWASLVHFTNIIIDFKSNLRFTEEFCRKYKKFTYIPYSLNTLPPSNSFHWYGTSIIIDEPTSTGLHPPPIHSYSPPKSLATTDLWTVSIVLPFSACHIIEIK